MKKIILSIIMLAIFCVSSAFAQVPTKGLMAYYPFNGNANDTSINHNNGTNYGATLTTDRFGNANSAYSFDGLSNKIVVPNSASLNIANSITISAWFKTNNPDINHSNNDSLTMIIAKHCTHGSRSFSIQFDSCSKDPSMGDSIKFQLFKTNDIESRNSIVSTYWDNKWHLIATTYDYASGIQSVYIDGQLKNSLNIGQINLEQTTMPLTIGCYSDLPFPAYRAFYHGALDDICIYNRALNLAGIDSLYNTGGWPNINSCLVAYYPFNGNANDASGNGFNGIDSGAVLTTDRFGNANSAYYFNGTAFIQVNTFPKLDSVFTYCAWLKPSTASTMENFGCYGTVSNTSGLSSWDVNYVNSSDLHVFDSRNSYISYTIPLANNWHFVSVIYTGTSRVIYVDGKFQTSQNISTPFPTQVTDAFRIGMHITGIKNQPFIGDIDDIRVFKCALDSADINTLYNESLCYQTITVTDTLIINANLVGFNPIAYQNSIKIYPNPTNDHITINFGSNYSTLSGYTLKITNSLGASVYNAPITQQSTTIALNTWTGKGVYVVYLMDTHSNIIDVRKIVLQ